MNIKQNSENIEELKENYKALQSQVDAFQTNFEAIQKNNQNINDDLLKKCEALTKDLDDQTNRNMRNTLVFYGIRESTEEDWDKTSKTLATYLSKLTRNKKLNQITYDIDRAHRSANNPDKKDEPRPIFAKFTTWKNAQFYKSLIINNNKSLKTKNKHSTVFVDQLYSKTVSKRRKQACTRI